ncbi:MAG: hypothetical protein ACK5H2_10800 [Beutenbergiaceae bacterium]
MIRRHALPDWVQAAASGRLLAAEPLSDDSWAVIGTSALALVDSAGVRWQRGWHEVDQGSWDGEAHTLTITWVGSDTTTRLQTATEHPSTFPVLFRERVEASVVYTESQQVPGGGLLKAAVRRTHDGRLLSQVFSVGAVHNGAELDRQVAALERRVRDAAGM